MRPNFGQFGCIAWQKLVPRAAIASACISSCRSWFGTCLTRLVFACPCCGYSTPLSPYALGTRMLLWFGHVCSSHRMFLDHGRYYGLGMDALVTVCSWITDVILVWAWMVSELDAMRTRPLLWFGHGCSSHLAVIMIWAWMRWRPHVHVARTL